MALFQSVTSTCSSPPAWSASTTLCPLAKSARVQAYAVCCRPLGRRRSCDQRRFGKVAKIVPVQMHSFLAQFNSGRERPEPSDAVLLTIFGSGTTGRIRRHTFIFLSAVAVLSASPQVRPTSLAVCRAIMRSSYAGMTHAATRLSSLVMQGRRLRWRRGQVSAAPSYRMLPGRRIRTLGRCALLDNKTCALASNWQSYRGATWKRLRTIGTMATSCATRVVPCCKRNCL